MSSIQFPFDIEKFFERCVKSKTIPKNDFEKQAVLLCLLKEFENDKQYAEQEVNEKLKKHFDDFTLLRRELVNFSYMQRNPYTGEYWVVRRTLTLEALEKNTLLKRHAKAFLKKE